MLIAEGAGRDGEEKLESSWPGVYVTAHPYTCAQVAIGTIGALNALIAEYAITGHWVTSWEYEAPAFGESVGLCGSRDWPVLEVGMPTWGSWRKAEVLATI